MEISLDVKWSCRERKIIIFQLVPERLIILLCFVFHFLKRHVDILEFETDIIETLNTTMVV